MDNQSLICTGLVLINKQQKENENKMKTTIKRTLATVLTVVMIFSLVPFAGTLFGSMATKASALETVEDSYEYLKEWIKYYYKDRDGNLYIYKPNNGAYLNGIYISTEVDYDEEKDQINFWVFNLSDSVSETYTLFINKDSSTYKIGAGIDPYYGGEKNNYAYSYVNPETYDQNTSLDYTFTTIQPEIAKNQAYWEKKIDSMLFNSIRLFNAVLELNMSITLGNFGFTKLWQPKEIPSVTVNIDANGGHCESSTFTVKRFVEWIDFDNYKPVKEGYTCIGFSKDKNSDELYANFDGLYSIREDINLYAVWQKNTVNPSTPVDPDEPTVDPDEPTVEPDKPSTDPVKPDDSKTPEDPSKPADAVTPGDSKTTASDAQKESGVKADTDAVISYKSSANRDGGTSPDTSESMDGIIAAVVTAFVGVTGLIIVKKKEKNED